VCSPQLDRGQLTAQALGDLVAGGHHTQRPLEADVLVITDHTTVTHGHHDDSICETDTGAILPPETIRRLCCNGRITPILLIDGIPVNVGREQRLATRAQRRALRALYRNCGFAGCETPFNRCEIHQRFPQGSFTPPWRSLYGRVAGNLDAADAPGEEVDPALRNHARSKRSRFITLVQAATKSFTKACCASLLA